MCLLYFLYGNVKIVINLEVILHAGGERHLFPIGNGTDPFIRIGEFNRHIETIDAICPTIRKFISLDLVL